GPDNFPAIENHRRSVAALALLAIDVEPHVEALRILDLVLGDEPGAQRAEGLAAFAFGPLAGTLDLKHPLGDVVGEAIAGDDIERSFFAQIARAAADDDAELDLPVELRGILWDDGVVVRPADAGRRLIEDDRLFRDRHAGFGGVVGIVQPDGDEIADLADASAEPLLAAYERQLFDFKLAQLVEALARKCVAGNVGHDFRKVAQPVL